MAEYLLILHEDPSDFPQASPEEIEGVVHEYVAWRQSLEDAGRLVGANKLADEGGRVLSSNGGGVRIVDGPYAEAKEVIGGYFLVTAENYDDAVDLARDCPHLKFGGRIELREVDTRHEQPS